MSRSLAIAVAVAASFGAGLIHLALGPEHLEELGDLGWGFYLAAGLQVGSAVLLLAAQSDRQLARVGVVTIAINLAILAAWVVSRTVGLPAGETPWVPESIGGVDVITALLEVAIVAALVGQLEHRGPASARRPRVATVLAVLVIAAGTAIGLSPDAAPGTAHEHAHGTTTDAHSAP